MGVLQGTYAYGTRGGDVVPTVDQAIIPRHLMYAVVPTMLLIARFLIVVDPRARSWVSSFGCQGSGRAAHVHIVGGARR